MATNSNEFEAHYHTACESTMSNIRSRDPWPATTYTGHYSTHIVGNDTASASCTRRRCHPALLISNTFSKPVHVVTNLPEEATPFCVSNEASLLQRESLMVMRAGPLQFVPHYSVCTNELDALRAPALARLQVEPANAASNCSSSLLYEAAQTTASSEEVIPVGGGSDYTINIVTLHSIWRLTRCHTTYTDSDNRDSTGLDEDDLFMIPTEESLISQQSSSVHELVIGY